MHGPKILNVKILIFCYEMTKHTSFPWQNAQNKNEVQMPSRKWWSSQKGVNHLYLYFVIYACFDISKSFFRIFIIIKMNICVYLCTKSKQKLTISKGLPHLLYHIGWCLLHISKNVPFLSKYIFENSLFKSVVVHILH